MCKLADKNIKTVTVNMFHMFKKVEENMYHEETKEIRRPAWKFQE